jgi:type IX secretion system PorP/SprF family membrane protein
MKKIYLILSVIWLLMPAITKGQQQPMVSQYMFNGLFINPAYAGSHRFINSSMHHRSQWVGFEGAPVTSIVAIDGLLPDKMNALGAIISHDKIGVTSETEILLNYAFHVQIDRNQRLSFGIRGGTSFYSANLHSLRTWDPGDQAFINDMRTQIFPKAGFGAYYYSNKYFAGISIPTLFVYDSKRDFSFDVTRSSMYHRHYFVTGGFIHKINEDIKVRPTVLVKYLPEAAPQADLNLSFLMYDTFWAGMSYRTNESVVALFEFHTNFGIRIGYSFDYNFTRIRHFSYGSHELLVGFEFGKANSNLKTPRYF